MEITHNPNRNNSSIRTAEIDELGGYLVAIDIDHHKVHESMHRLIHEGIVSSGQHDMVLVTGPGPVEVHMVPFFSADEKTVPKIYANPVYTGGTEIKTDIFRRRLSQTPDFTVLTSVLNTPTVTANGVLIDGAHADKRILTRGEGELVLAPNSTYLISIGFSKNTANFIMGFDFYEEEPKFSE